MQRACVSILLLASALSAQVQFADPPHLVPRTGAVGATDPATGDLYLLGGRRDRVLDLWRLRSGAWSLLAEAPFQGEALDLAWDAARQRLVAPLREDGGQRRLYEFDGVQWLTGPVLANSEHQVEYDTARQQLLVWSQIPQTPYGGLYRWNGTTLVPQFTFNVGHGLFGYDTARGRALVVRHDGVWEWDGAAWTFVPMLWPDQLYGQLATDPWTGRVVDFATDYWTGARIAHAWTGSQWTPWSLHGMPARSLPTLVGNPQRQRLQLVGGGDPYAHGDTFESDGASWQQVTADTAHPVFEGPAMAGTGPGTALLFDGGSAVRVPQFAQTARWQNGAWTVLQPAHTPGPRTGFALAGNGETGDVYMFGGLSNGAPLADFWHWNGTDWVQLPSGPAARHGAALCVDTLRDSVVLYGGVGRNDSWEFYNGNWQQVAANFPPHLGPATMAYDALRRRCVLVTFGLLGVEAWELAAYPNRNWISTNPSSRPTGFSSNLTVAYDPWRQRTIVVDPAYGGNQGRGEAFEWDGSSWRSFGAEPRLALATAVTAVPGIGLMAQNGIDRFATTQSYAFPAVVAEFGSPCITPSWRLTSTPPWLGRTLALRYPVPVLTAALFATGFSNTWSGTTALPYSLAAFGFPTCSIQVDPLIVQARAWNDGAATLEIALPLDPALAGVVLYHQALSPFAGVFSASQGVVTTLGSLW